MLCLCRFATDIVLHVVEIRCYITSPGLAVATLRGDHQNLNQSCRVPSIQEVVQEERWHSTIRTRIRFGLCAIRRTASGAFSSQLIVRRRFQGEDNV